MRSLILTAIATSLLPIAALAQDAPPAKMSAPTDMQLLQQQSVAQDAELNYLRTVIARLSADLKDAQEKAKDCAPKKEQPPAPEPKKK